MKRDEEEDVATVLDFDDDPEFDLSHITARQQSREEIIAAAEAAAFNDEAYRTIKTNDETHLIGVSMP